jgi:hypothetical protein
MSWSTQPVMVMARLAEGKLPQARKQIAAAYTPTAAPHLNYGMTCNRSTTASKARLAMSEDTCW